MNYVANIEENDNAYLVNTKISAKRKWDANRKNNIIALIRGELKNSSKPSATEIESLIKEVNVFEIITTKLANSGEDINPFMKKHPLKKQVNFKLISTSKEYYHNGNVDESMLVVLHCLDYLNLNELTQNIHRRAARGRPSKGLIWENVINKCKGIEDKAKIMRVILLQKPKLYFFGHMVSRYFGDEEQGGVIRSYLKKVENDVVEHCWNVY